MKSLYQFARACVTGEAMASAAFHLMVGAALVVLAFWLVWPFDVGWPAGVAAGFLGFIGVAIMLKAAAIFSSTEPKNERPLRRPFAFESTRDNQRRKRSSDH
jgi:hypothetical protein